MLVLVLYLTKVQGRVVQSPIKLTQYFDFSFVFVLVKYSVYIVCPSVLSCSNLKLHQTIEVKTSFKQEDNASVNI